MDAYKNTFHKIEDLLLSKITRNEVAPRMVAEIVGTFIDIKPCCLIGGSHEFSKESDYVDLLPLITELDFKYDFTENVYATMILISKSEENIEKTKGYFQELWNLKDEESRSKIEENIGKLLGYPETAIDFFNNSGEDITDPGRKARIDRTRFYIHSIDFEDAEFKLYEDKIYRAMEILTPKSAEKLKQNTAKRWE